MWEQAPLEMQLAGNKIKELGDVWTETGQRCVQQSVDDNKSTISCDLIDSQIATNTQFDITLNFQRLLQNVENEAKKINEQMAKNKRTLPKPVIKKDVIEEVKKLPKAKKGDTKKRSAKDENAKMPPLGHPVFPTTMPTMSNLYFDATGWPSKEECMGWNLPLTDEDDLNIPVFLPPENKGYQ